MIAAWCLGVFFLTIASVFLWLIWVIIRREQRQSRGEFTERERRMIEWLHHEYCVRPAHHMESREISLTMLIGREEQVSRDFPAEGAQDSI